jgi:5-formyltetrahydrofolate cyclo-ligase
MQLTFGFPICIVEGFPVSFSATTAARPASASDGPPCRTTTGTSRRGVTYFDCRPRIIPLGETVTELMEAKNILRRTAYDARHAQKNKDRVSEVAVANLMQLPEYRAAKTALWYLDCRSELRTRHAITGALESDKKIVVPYCTVDDFGANKLGLWWLQSMDELVVGNWKILEPPRDRWNDPGKAIDVEQLDIVIVPGVAFSRRGGRMGNGQGYYDRLLDRVRPDCPLVALCYECQLFDNLVVGPHDVFMDKVVTEKATYVGQGRS